VTAEANGHFITQHTSFFKKIPQQHLQRLTTTTATHVDQAKMHNEDPDENCKEERDENREEESDENREEDSDENREEEPDENSKEEPDKN